MSDFFCDSTWLLHHDFDCGNMQQNRAAVLQCGRGQVRDLQDLVLLRPVPGGPLASSLEGVPAPAGPRVAC